MSIPKKRSYHSDLRQAQSQKTKNRILASAKMLFESKGFEKATIEEIAQEAQVSAPSIYAIFQSKRGVLLGLMDEALAPEQFEALVEQGKKEKCPRKRLEITASIARQLYDAEKAQLSFLRGASILDPVFKGLEIERERRRYQRQKETVEAMANEKAFTDNFSFSRIRDILWAFTGRDLYRMFVIERGWSSDEYEKWLAELLIQALLSKSLHSTENFQRSN
ncbi:MAG: TetR/AcrR family transcriptional regulator [Simkania negevensis]|nr:TetR/AcrR family transcriptional regulator [Simkania negevensis]